MNAITARAIFDDATVNDDAAPSAPRILVLANDLTAGRGVMPLVVGFAGRIAQVATADEAIELARSGDYDVVVVDFRPDVLGYQAICKLRVASIDLPILLISARSTPDAFDRARAIGADDVMTLPVDVQTLRDRIAALAGRARTARAVLRIGRLELDLTAREAAFDGQHFFLSASEYAVLELLVTRNGAPAPKTELAALTNDGRGLDSLIGRLRRKLALAGAGEMVRAVWGQGYAINALPMATRSLRPAARTTLARAA